MPIYTIFNTVTGRKRVVLKPRTEGSPTLSDDEIFVEGKHNDKILVDGKIADKPASKITLIGTKLENLPNPTTVTITGHGATFRRIITDGIYEFSIDVPGKYIIKCESRVGLPITFDLEVK